VVYYWISLGCVFVVYLLGVEYKVGVICPLCTGIHVITALMFWVARKLHREEQKFLLDPPSVWETVWQMRAFLYAGVFMAGTLIFILYMGFNASANSSSPPSSAYSSASLLGSMATVEKTADTPTLNVDVAKDNVGTITTPDGMQYDLPALYSCVTGAGWVFYGSNTCGACKIQKRIIGGPEYMAMLAFVDCDVDPRCVEKGKQGQGITKFPTWVQEKPVEGDPGRREEVTRAEGIQTMIELGKLTSCALF
jgi:hypothetical protein